MLYEYSRKEIKEIVSKVVEGKTYQGAIDELYPKSKTQCLCECALEYRRSFSLIKAIFNALTKKESPINMPSCSKCLTHSLSSN